jgi:2-oxoglutarate ferredoxin oxidoreductase subunit gamma
VVVKVPARELAQAAGATRAANLVMLGAFAGATDVLPAERIESAITQEFSGDRARFAASSIAAFRAGLDAGRQARRRVG